MHLSSAHLGSRQLGLHSREDFDKGVHMSNIDTTEFKFAQFRNGNGWGNTMKLASAKIVWEI